MTTAIRLSKKAFTTAVVVTTILWSIGAAALINPLVAQGAVALANLVDGDLIMTDGAAAGATVYMYSGSKKYPFPNQNVYASWYGSDFSALKKISSEDMGSIAWGDNMLYRPGSRLVKVPDDPKVYAVLPAGVVAWVKDEATAQKFYGAAWASRVDDLLASLFVANYTNDPSKDLTTDAGYPDGTVVKVTVAEAALMAAAVKYYYLSGGEKREISTEALAQFRTEFILEVTEADISGLTAGTAVGTGEFLNPVAVQEGTTTPGVEAPETPAATGELSAALAADSRTLRILDGTALNPVAKWTLTAGSSAVSVTSVKIKKIGTTTNSYITGIRAVDADGETHGNVVSSINDDNTVTLNFADDPITVPANGSATVEVRLDFNTSAGASDIKLELQEVGGAATVTGLPVSGFLIDIKNGGSIVNTITFDLDGPANNTSVQMSAELEIFNFTLRDTASYEKSTFESIHLYNNGSVTADDVKDYKLVAPNGDTLQTVQQVGKWVKFTGLNYEMVKGATKSFKVKATPLTGSTRTIDLQLQQDYDLMVKGQTSEHYILATADGSGSNDTSYPVGDADGYTTMTLAAGSLTLDKAVNSPTTNYAVAESDVVLGRFTVKATGEDHEVRQIKFAVYENAASETDLSGSIFIKSGGSTLYSTAFSAATHFVANTTSVATTAITLSTYLTVKAGEQADIDIVGTIGSTATSNDKYGASLDVTQVKRLTTGDLADPSVSVVNASARDVKAAALVMTNVTMSASGTYKLIASTNGALVSKFTLNASSGGEDARVNSIVMRLDIDGTGNAVTDWSNWRMYRLEDDGTETLLNTSNNTNTGAATVTFTFITPQVIGKADINGEIYVLRANLAGTVGAGETAIFSTHASSSEIKGDTTGNDVTERIINGGSAAPLAGGTTIITATGGQLKIALDTAVSPSINSLVNVGTTAYTLGAFTLKAEDESQKVKELRIEIVGSTMSSTDVRNLKMYLDGAATPLTSVTQLKTEINIGDHGYIDWSSSDKLFEIDAGQTRKIKLVGDIAGTGSVRLGDDVRADISNSAHVTSTGIYTNTAASNTLLSQNTITHTIQPFTVTVSEASPAYPASNVESNPSTGTLLAKFKLLNGGAVSITTTQFKLYNNGSCTHQGSVGSPCNESGVSYQLKTSAENADSTTLVVSNGTQNEVANVLEFGATSSTIHTGDTSTTNAAYLVIAGGRYRTFGIYVSTTMDDFSSGSTWQFSVSTEGDVTFGVAESALGYDADIDGDQTSSITGLKARGKPSLPTITDKTT